MNLSNTELKLLTGVQMFVETRYTRQSVKVQIHEKSYFSNFESEYGFTTSIRTMKSRECYTASHIIENKGPEQG